MSSEEAPPVDRSALLLTLRATREGGFDCRLQSPTGSPRHAAAPAGRSTAAAAAAAAPPRPSALKTGSQASTRRVQFSDRAEMLLFNTEEEVASDQQQQQRAPPVPGSPGWQSPPPAYAPAAATQPAVTYAYLLAAQQQQQQPHWQQPVQQPVPLQQQWQAYSLPSQEASWVPPQQPTWQPEQQQQPPVPSQQQQQQQHQQQPAAAPAASAAGLEDGSATPRHLEVHAGTVSIHISSPDVHLKGLRGSSGDGGSTGTQPPQQQAAEQPPAVQQPEPPAVQLPRPPSVSAGTQTDAVAAPSQVAFAAELQQGGQRVVVQPPAVELPPGIPAREACVAPELPLPPPQGLPPLHTAAARSSAPPGGGLGAAAQARAASQPWPFQSRQAAAAAAVGPAMDSGSSACLQAESSFLSEEGRSGAATGGSLSSGLSPSEGCPRQQEWDQADALRALAAGAGAYGHAARQALRGRGGPVSATDALPARLAAQQLGSLAGMSRKVQEALLHTQAVFARQAGLVEQAVLARAFYAWRHLHVGRQQRRAAALAARRRVDLGALRRCLHAWRRGCGCRERHQAALGRARALLQRGLLARAWREWRRLCGLRWWKLQLEAREAHIQRLGLELRHLESRPVRYMTRFRLRAQLAAWRQQAAYQQAKRAMEAAAQQRARQTALAAALGGWLAVAAEAAARQRALQRARRLLARRRVGQVLAAWLAAVQSEAAWRQRVAAAKQLRRRHLVLRALRGWRYISWFRCAAREAACRRQLATTAAALHVWRGQAALAAAEAALLDELQQARAARLTARCFGGWLAVLEGQRARWQEAELDRLAGQVEALEGQNGALRADNERLARVIDSGDWGRQRVQELLQAGRVLQEERDALARLVSSLQSGSGAGGGGLSGGVLQDATNSPLASPQLAAPACGGLLAGRPGTGLGAAAGIAGVQPFASLPLPAGGASRPSSPAARNKLLVRNGSSFNAMVRALKQDLAATGALQRGGPAAVLEVDKLSLHHLTVAADGGMEVQAVGSPDRVGVAFGSSYPPSPKRQPALGSSGSGGGAAPPAGSTRASSSLLAAALRLQGLGGRSVGLRGSGAAGETGAVRGAG